MTQSLVNYIVDHTHLPQEVIRIYSVCTFTTRVYQDGESRLTFAPSPPRTVNVILEAARRRLNWRGAETNLIL